MKKLLRIKPTLKNVKVGTVELRTPFYKVKPYVVLSDEGVVLSAGTLEEIKQLDAYFDDCVVEIRQHDLHANDNTKIELSKTTAQLLIRQTTVTRHRGGQVEKIVALNEVRIPDVFNYGKTEYDRNVVETWHIAHDLKAELEVRAIEKAALEAVAKALPSILQTAKGWADHADRIGKGSAMTRSNIAAAELAIANLDALRAGQKVEGAK